MSKARDRRKHQERIDRWPQLKPRLIGTFETIFGPKETKEE